MVQSAGGLNFSFLQNPQVLDAMAQTLAQSGPPPAAPESSALGGGLAGQPAAGGIDPRMLALQAVGASLGQQAQPRAVPPYIAGLGPQTGGQPVFSGVRPASVVQLPRSLG